MPNTSMATQGPQDRRTARARRYRQRDRDHHRVVRLPSLLRRHGACVRQAVLPQFRAAGWHLAGVRDLRGRFPGEAHRSIHLWHYGDRIGRKSTLIATLLLMGLSTFVVALVPTYDNIGIWGAVLLTATPTSPESPGVALHLPSLFWLGSRAKQ